MLFRSDCEYKCIRVQKKQESPNDNNANDTEDTVEETTDGPEAQEIDRLTVVQMVRICMLVPALLHWP